MTCGTTDAAAVVVIGDAAVFSVVVFRVVVFSVVAFIVVSVVIVVNRGFIHAALAVVILHTTLSG